MEPESIQKRNLEHEFVFTASRSSGPGGQKVNKVSTKVELRFNISASALFSEQEKQILFSKLSNKINQKGELVLESQSERSQIRNKEKVIEKFYFLVAWALTIPKRRRPTRPTLSSKLKRMKTKRIIAEKKAMRKKPDQ